MDTINSSYSMQSIGIFQSQISAKHRAPRQPDSKFGIDGIISLHKGMNFEQALTDLEGFSHLWVLYVFHKAEGWKPMVLPPRGEKKRGVFATRSPYRPNQIGMSVVGCRSIDGLNIHVQSSDILDGTPILDIKPYIPYADSIPDAKSGWLDEISSIEFSFIIDEEVIVHNAELLVKTGEDYLLHAKHILRESPFPHPYRRIKNTGENEYEVAVNTMRFRYAIDNAVINIKEMYEHKNL